MRISFRVFDFRQTNYTRWEILLTYRSRRPQVRSGDVSKNQTWDGSDATYNTLADVKDGDYFVMRTGTSQGQYAADIEDFKADFTDFEAIGKSDWQAYSVPEPTSGLLLLLGVAGLALKRRRA